MAHALIILGLLGGPITATKTATVISDPVNGTLTPKATPGAVIEYTIGITNSSLYTTDSGTVVITDAIPTNTKLRVADLNGAGSGPISTAQGTPVSGLSATYTSLSSTSDDMSFSNNGGAAYTYTPTVDANGYDAAVTNIRIQTRGTGAVGGVFIIKFRAAVK